MNQIELPSGLRDMIGGEVISKKKLISRIEDTFASYGYEPIITPTIEFYRTYANAFSSLDEEEMYKFFDQDGQILTLRTDMTVPIARAAATKYRDVEPPLRFSYTADVYKVRHSFAGKRNEVTDCGVELIGADSQSDPEVLSLAVDVMRSFGVKDYTLEIGNSDFFREAAGDAGLNAEQAGILADLTDRKSMVDLQEFLESVNLDAQKIAFFMHLPLLSGGREVLKEARVFCYSDALAKEIGRLEDLDDVLRELGQADHISYDLGKVPHLDYYTGIIFEGWVGGVGTSVLSGGRYDDLLKKFGRDLPACGFGVKADELLDVLPKEEVKTRVLLYPRGQIRAALKMAAELRRSGPVALKEADVEEPEVQA